MVYVAAVAGSNMFCLVAKLCTSFTSLLALPYLLRALS